MAITDPSIENSDVAKRQRKLVKTCLQFFETSDAVYWADKLVSLTSYHLEDVYLLCRSLFADKQYKRCAVLIKDNSLEAEIPAFRLLAARCHFELNEWEEALSVLEGGNYNCFSATGKPNLRRTVKTSNRNTDCIDWGMSHSQINSRIHLLLGKVYEAIENRELAEKNFRESLKLDVFTHDAFERLTKHHLLTGQEEEDLFNSLPFHEQCSSDECAKLVKFLYESNLKKCHKVSKTVSKTLQSVSPQISQALSENNEVKTSYAERLFFNNEFHQCYVRTKEILKSDPMFKPTLMLHISVLVELNKSNELFSLAHSLIDVHPEYAVSWLAVGCYYFLIGRQDPARRFLKRAISIDNMNGPCWLVNAHSFAAENEHDQAMAAYFTAAKLMRGFHLPSLYIGLEYTVTNNLTLAEKFTREALHIAPEDPNVLHELGVILYNKGDMDGAEKCMLVSMQKVDELQSEVPSSKWQPLLNNLAHVYRATGKYNDAVQLHERALNLNPNSASTYSSLGLVHCYLFNWTEAIGCFHRALSFKREDAFTVAMLKIALEKSISSPNSSSVVSKFEEVSLDKIKLGRPELKHEGDLDDFNLTCEIQKSNSDAAFQGQQHERVSAASFISNNSLFSEGDQTRHQQSSLMDLDDSI